MPAPSPRGRRLRAPLLLALAALLAIEAAGGFVIFIARVVNGSAPGSALHVFAGAALTVAYLAYQWPHWTRVRPWRARLDYVMGLIAACAMALTLATGLVLGGVWWQARPSSSVTYPSMLSAAHNIGSMLVLTFAGAHLGAVLLRDRTRALPREEP
jgi:hypothetical protein